MPNLISTENFEPSKDVKDLWLCTRKKEYTDVKLYGLFQTYGFKRDATIFFFVVVLEIIGLGFLIYAKAAHPVTVFTLFLLDFTFAVLSHWNHGKICKLENKKTLKQNNLDGSEHLSTEEKQKIDFTDIGKYKNWSAFFKFLICLIALFKIFLFFSNATAIHPALKLAIIATYILVATGHCYSTGYWGSEVLLRRRMNNEKKKHLNSQTAQTVTETRPFALPNEYSFSVANTAKHKVVTDGGNKLITWGILQDGDLENLITQQSKEKDEKKNEDAKKQLALHGLKCQLQILDKENAFRST